MKKIREYIFYNVLKWKIVGDTNFAKKCIIIAAPHTHWSDFFIAIFARSLFDNKNVYFIGKKELFTFPLKYFMNWLGGMPVNRNSNSNSVDLIADLFNQNESFILALSPEGTRKKVSSWKTGFYYIAKKANVPIYSVALDFENKQIKVFNPFIITGNIDNDITFLRSLFKGINGKIPEYS